jgi:hypothetical protein
MKRSKISYDLQVSIFFRDKWLCHWCRKPGIFGPAIKYLEKWVQDNGYKYPIAYYHERWRRNESPLLDLLGVIIDHRLAHSKNGRDTKENLVTSCNKCNLQKSDKEVQKLVVEQSFKFVKGRYGEPKNWDGLVSLFIVLAEKYSSGLTESEKQWLKSLQNYRSSLNTE